MNLKPQPNNILYDNILSANLSLIQNNFKEQIQFKLHI